MLVNIFLFSITDMDTDMNFAVKFVDGTKIAKIMKVVAKII